MTRTQRTQASARQRIRALVAETRGVQLSEVQYPRSNDLYYWYLLEAGEVSRYQYEHLIYRNYYPITQDARNDRNYPQRFLRIIIVNNERLVYQIDRDQLMAFQIIRIDQIGVNQLHMKYW